MQELKDSVIKTLVSDHEFLIDDAAQAVEDSVVQEPDMWNDNADAKDLANYLAEAEDEG